MNSFRFIERGIKAEIARQQKILAGGGVLIPGDTPLRPGLGRHHVASLQGGGARLPLLPRAGPDPGGDRQGRCSRPPARRCQSCRPPRAERLQSPLGLSAESARPAGLPRRARRLLRGRPGGRGRARAGGADARQLDHGRAAGPAWVTSRTRPRALVSAPRMASLVGLVTAKADHRRRRPGRSSRALDRRGRGAGRHRRGPRASRAMDSGDELAAIVAAALAANPDAAQRVRDGNAKAIGPIVGPGHARDQGPRRRHRGIAAHQPAARLSA